MEERERYREREGPTVRDPPLEGSSTGSRRKHQTQRPPKALGHVDEQQINRHRNIATRLPHRRPKTSIHPSASIPEHPSGCVYSAAICRAGEKTAQTDTGGTTLLYYQSFQYITLE